MNGKYSKEAHSEAIQSTLTPAIDAYRSYLKSLQVSPVDIEDCTNEILKVHGKGLRKAGAFVQFINGLLNLDL